MRSDELLLYRNMPQEQIMRKVEYLTEHCGKTADAEEEKRCFFETLNQLLVLADQYGLKGNLWQAYLTILLASHENPYSMACEISGVAEGTLGEVAAHDFEIFRELFALDLSCLCKDSEGVVLSMIQEYHVGNRHGTAFNRRIRDRIEHLTKELADAKNLQEFQDAVTEFYKEYGVGKFGLHKAFRIERAEDRMQIIPITKTAHVELDDLIGYETAKKKLIQNTEAFVEGKSANNCLLFGAAGTGKSSAIKAILNRYYDQGLRMIEVYKHQFQDLHEVIQQIKNRNYRFIIYMDDLSFEEFEIEYKYLKAVIEGGLEKKPENILIYATSNRRHLIRESFRDREEYDSDIHANDTVQEKLSLVARFGETIFFDSPAKKEFQQIVCELAKRNGIKLPQEQLLLEANRWELTHGGLSGRTAQQFIDHLKGSR